LDREVFLCPFCSAVLRAELSPGTSEVKCKHCGGLVLVPSRVSGLDGQCPNHPGSRLVGLCNNCRESFCEQCLHVIGLGDRNLYLCPTCTTMYIRSYSKKSPYLIVAGALIFLVGFFQILPATVWISSISEQLVIYGLAMLLGGLLVRFHFPAVTTLEKKRRSDIEYSVTWAECPHCKVGYLYAPSRIGPDCTVMCLNCNREFKLG
jgi:DNA-directed RNA polymerase subunit RPC12/RpoP